MYTLNIQSRAHKGTTRCCMMIVGAADCCRTYFCAGAKAPCGSYHHVTFPSYCNLFTQTNPNQPKLTVVCAVCLCLCLCLCLCCVCVCVCVCKWACVHI